MKRIRSRRGIATTLVVLALLALAVLAAAPSPRADDVPIIPPIAVASAPDSAAVADSLQSASQPAAPTGLSFWDMVYIVSMAI